MPRRIRLLNRVTLCMLLGSSAVGCGASIAAEKPTGTIPAASASAARAMPAAHVGGGSSASCVSGSVYFGVDSASLDSASLSQLACIAHNAERVSVVGMTDPRGTEEYNLALGERRARSVAEHLGRLGYDASHIETRSLGEEVAIGKGEDDWARDRRVNFAAQ